MSYEESTAVSIVKSSNLGTDEHPHRGILSIRVGHVRPLKP